MSSNDKPVVLSYCATFLKPEMHHVYRQVTGLHRYRTIILTRSHENREVFPFDSVIEIPHPRVHFISHFYGKYICRVEPLVYRGESDQLLKLVNRQQADLMHVYFGHIGVHLLPFLKRWKKSAIVSFHGMDTMPRLSDPQYGRHLKELFGTVCLVLARSESLQRKLMELGCPEEKIRLNRTGIPMESFPRVHRVAPREGAWQLIQACRLIEKKGIQDSLRAFAKFRREFSRAQFHIVGDGPLRNSLGKIARDLELGSSVQFHGFCSQNYLYNLLAQSHIFLHPSRITLTQDQEGIPNALLEAMATGLPVVATYHGGIPEAVTTGQEGLLVEEENWHALAKCLHEIASSPEWWLALGASAATSVRQKFEQSAQIDHLEHTYDEARSIKPIEQK